MVYHLRSRRVDKFSGVLGYPGTTQTFTPSVSSKNRVLNIGLTEKEQAEFEKLLGLKEGDMTPQLQPNGKLISEFWRLYTLEIPPAGLDLDDTNVSERLAIKLLHVSTLATNKKGAPSAKAKWEVYSDESEAIDLNVVRSYKKKAYKLWDEMSMSDMVEYLTSIGKDVQSTSPKIVESLVGNEVEVNPKMFIERMESPLRRDRSWIYALLHNQILKEMSGALYYNDIQIGLNVDTSIDYLNKKEEANQQLKLALIREMEIIHNRDNIKPVGTGTPEQEQEKETIAIPKGEEVEKE